MVHLFTWAGEPVNVMWYSSANLLAWLFWVNYVLFLLNIVLVGFPMDAGRMLQCILWPHVGYRQATLYAVFAGFITCVVLGVYAMWQNDVLVLCLCLFIFISCKNQWMILETGGDDRCSATTISRRDTRAWSATSRRPRASAARAGGSAGRSSGRRRRSSAS